MLPWECFLWLLLHPERERGREGEGEKAGVSGVYTSVYVHVQQTIELRTISYKVVAGLAVSVLTRLVCVAQCL